MMIRFLSVAAAGLCLSTAASGVAVASYDFDGSTAEGFLGTNTSALTVTEGVLSGTSTNTDPQLRLIGAGIDVTPTFDFDQVIVRVRETNPAGDVVAPPAPSGSWLLRMSGPATATTRTSSTA